MKTTLALVCTLLASPLALADACHVVTHASSAKLPKVDVETCYEYQGMPEEAVGWSCNDDTPGALGSEKRKVSSCAAGYFGRCTAAVTQESLANPKSAGTESQSPSLKIPDKAKLVTYYYHVEDQGQAKIDCEKTGGQWQ